MSVDLSARSRLLAALERHAKRTMKWGWDVVRQIEPVAVEHHRVWSAELDTLIEERHVRRIRRAAEPDAKENKAQRTSDVDPWTVVVEVPLDFHDHTAHVDIAGTEQVRTCPMCHGETRIRCPECGGEGMAGYRRTCLTCRGTGQTACDACDGQGRLAELRTVELIRRHQNRRHVDTDTPVPVEALFQAKRDELLHLDIPKVSTATYDTTMEACRGRGPCPDEAFEQAVRSMLIEAEVRAPAKIVRQRMVVRHVPVDEVTYDWRGDPGTFWLVGTEEQVFGQDMPLQRAFVSRAVSAAKQRFGGLLGN